MFNKIFGFLVFISFYTCHICNAQDCNFTVKGYVYDDALDAPLAYVNVFIQETQEGTTTDDDGNFILENICKGHYHFIVSHIGCADEKFHFDIDRDTVLRIAMSHSPTSIGTVVIAGKKNDHIKQANLSVNRNIIEDNSEKSFSSILENETGVHLIKNGSGISKPVVQGLYGNRLIILNNGIAQSGQQWGNDHSPEIDPFASDKIQVLKAANAIAYGAGNLGAVILSQPNRIKREPHLHGQVNYIFDTNGRGNTLNGRLEKYSPVLAWRVNGTIKKYGDRSTAKYFLRNTGLEEVNFSLQLEKTLKEKIFLEFYASTFNTQLGILRGSHIGNTEDLQLAFDREIPFYTEADFSYQLAAPKQDVSHHLAKSKLKYFIQDNQIVELVLAGQINDRKEFDIRRSGRTDIPALSLKQYTFNSELKYSNTFNDNWSFNLGQQNIITDNTNNPETGILPLIPDYLFWKSGLYTTLSIDRAKTSFNLGLRYDFENQTALTISNTEPREIVRFENKFNNIHGLFGIRGTLTEAQSLAWNIGFAMRNPGVNELYSNGLHQGVSGIEEGDNSLEVEKALKNTLEYKWLPNSNFSFNTLLYQQYFSDYIFLSPQEEIRLTIRGAFPVFKYQQTNAHIYGVDVSSQFTVHNSFLGLLKYSYLKGNDITNDEPLIYMPPNIFFASLTYRAPKKLKVASQLTMEDFEIEMSSRFVFEQKHILASQDFVPPPSSYTLFGIKLSSNFIFPSYKIRAFMKVDNLFSASYRDYLNRQRYFADDLGRSIKAGINIRF